MKRYAKLLKKVRRQWILEHSARRVLQVLAWSVNAAILLLLLHVFGLPVFALAVVPAAAVVALIVIVWSARSRAPRGRRLLQLLDERAGTEDLFTSASEFEETPERFGWMGVLTCQLAEAASVNATPRGRWTLGTLRQWTPALATAAILVCLHMGVRVYISSVEVEPTNEIAVIEKPDTTDKHETTSEDKKPVEEPAPKEEPDKHAPTEDDFAPAEPEEPSEDVVQITDEMIEKYMDDPGNKQEIDLTGVTPIQWDDEEIDEAANPKEGEGEEEKIDPVKLDADLLKDLQAAKKEKLGDDGGEDKGVDVAVMGKESAADKPKNEKGGKNDQGGLAGAVTKDPRGNPTRLSIKLAKKGFSIRSAMAAPQMEKGQDRPMGILEFMAAIRNTQSKYSNVTEPASSGVAVQTENRVVRQEQVAQDAAQVTERYFEQLRREDK